MPRKNQQGLVIYRRHSDDCPYRDNPISKKCKCPVWLRGTLDGTTYRESLKTRNLAEAERRKQKLEGGEEPVKISLADAIAHYKADCEARNLAESTQKKMNALLSALQAFAESKGRMRLDQIGVPELRAFRETWKTWGALTQAKNIERARAFFRFCVQSKWITESPAHFLKAPKSESSKVSVFTDDELKKIHAEIKRPIMRAFVLVLQHTGLRISDAVKLRKQDIEDGRLKITTQKTKSVVWLPLPPIVISALEALRTTEYYFWTGESKLSTAVGSRRRGLAKLFKRAKVKGNPHMFRHTLATTLLTNGTQPTIVAKILGNSERIVLKHYDHWIPARQAQLEAELQKTWAEPVRLVRVK